MTIDKEKLAQVADSVQQLSARFDAMCSRGDDWSPEAREAAAKARGHNASEASRKLGGGVAAQLAERKKAEAGKGGPAARMAARSSS